MVPGIRAQQGHVHVEKGELRGKKGRVGRMSGQKQGIEAGSIHQRRFFLPVLRRRFLRDGTVLRIDRLLGCQGQHFSIEAQIRLFDTRDLHRRIGRSRLIPLSGNHLPSVLNHGLLKNVMQVSAMGRVRGQDTKASMPEVLHGIVHQTVDLEGGRHGGAEPIPSELFDVRQGRGGRNKGHGREVRDIGQELNLSGQ